MTDETDYNDDYYIKDDQSESDSNGDYYQQDDQLEDPLYIYGSDSKSHPVIEYIHPFSFHEHEENGYEDHGELNKDTYIEGKKESQHEDQNHSTFPILSQSGTYVIEFYAPWCPHCRHYKYEYIELAKEVTRRSLSPVMFLAISCDANEPICEAYDIDTYPTLLGFSHISLEADETISSLKMHKENSIILNEEGNPTADSISQDLGLKLTIETNQRSSHNDDNDNMEIFNLGEIDTKESRAVHYSTKKKLKEREYHRHIDDVYKDAYRSFVFVLKTGIFLSTEPLADDRVDALLNFLRLLEVTTPKNWIGNDLVLHLQHNFGTILKGKVHLITTIKELQNDEIDLNIWEYQCSFGEIGRGFTCGLWELFHIIAIGVAEKSNAELYGTNEIISTYNAGKTLYDFIRHFFGCQECRTNFEQMYETCGFNHCNRLTTNYPLNKQDAKEFPLWLWEVHNDVNMRITLESAVRHGRKVTKEELEASRWPSVKTCPQCWHKNSKVVSWNSEEIYKMLREQYWSRSHHPSKHTKIDYLSFFISFFLSGLLLVAFLLKRKYFIQNSLIRPAFYTKRRLESDQAYKYNV